MNGNKNNPRQIALNDEVRKVKTMNDLKQFAVDYVTIQTELSGSMTAKDFGDKLKLNPTTVKNYLKILKCMERLNEIKWKKHRANDGSKESSPQNLHVFDTSILNTTVAKYCTDVLGYSKQSDVYNDAPNNTTVGDMISLKCVGINHD
eukprot:291938_1